MSQSIDWLIPGRVIHVRLEGAISLEQMRAGNQELIEALDSGQPPIHVLIDDQALVSIPASLRQHQLTMNFLRHPALGWVIGAGRVSAVLRLISSVTSYFFKVQTRRFDTLDEALRFLREQDPSLDWAQSPTQPGSDAAEKF